MTPAGEAAPGSSRSPARWTRAWPDLLAFAMGLAVACGFGWSTTDLVWSLWLSSLVVGYASIVWAITRPAVPVLIGVWRDRATVLTELRKDLRPAIVGAAVLGGGGLFLLSFFTFHFGMFHMVHAAFLGYFFPLRGGWDGHGMFMNVGSFFTIMGRYCWWLPAAFVAERAAFSLPGDISPPTPEDTAVTPEAIARRRARGVGSSDGFGNSIVAPYRNVVRMHLLIFFFAGAHFAGLGESFVVYAVVYAVYFFPWRLLKPALLSPAAA